LIDICITKFCSWNRARDIVQGRNAQLRSTLGQAQRALLTNIADALAAMNAAQNAFDQPKTPPQLGSDPVKHFRLFFITQPVLCI